jgi:hypothetical protein
MAITEEDSNGLIIRKDLMTSNIIPEIQEESSNQRMENAESVPFNSEKTSQMTKTR